MNTEQRLKRIYGNSHFGSGGAYGSVKCENCEEYGCKDNGFVCGPEGVRVIDANKSAYVSAKGGDMIGDGREWKEKYEYTPGVGWVEIVSKGGVFN